MLGFVAARQMCLAFGRIVCPLFVAVADEVPVYAKDISDLQKRLDAGVASVNKANARSVEIMPKNFGSLTEHPKLSFAFAEKPAASKKEFSTGALNVKSDLLFFLGR
jgi:hypothetical protein